MSKAFLMSRESGCAEGCDGCVGGTEASRDQRLGPFIFSYTTGKN